MRDIAPSTHLFVQSAQPFHVAVLGEHLRSRTGSWCAAMVRTAIRSCIRTTSPSNDDLWHRRVLGQPVSVVGILVACQTTDTDWRRPINRCCTLRPPRLSCSSSGCRLRQFERPCRPPRYRTRDRPTVRRCEVMVAPRNSNRTRRSKRSLARGLVLSPCLIGCRSEWVRNQELECRSRPGLALKITTTLSYSDIR